MILHKKFDDLPEGAVFWVEADKGELKQRKKKAGKFYDPSTRKWIEPEEGFEVKVEEENPSDADIAREQNTTRQAINVRRKRGWTQEEIEAGVRSESSRAPVYETPITQTLGMTVKEAADLEGVNPSEIYRRFRQTRTRASVFLRHQAE